MDQQFQMVNLLLFYHNQLDKLPPIVHSDLILVPVHVHISEPPDLFLTLVTNVHFDRKYPQGSYLWYRPTRYRYHHHRRFHLDPIHPDAQVEYHHPSNVMLQDHLYAVF
ncbi:hypothetical protein D3C72_1876820 [compost metagenome]